MKPIRRNAVRPALRIGAFVVLATPALADPPDTTARNEAQVRAAFEKWEAGGSVFESLLAQDVRWTIHGSGPVAGTYESLDSFVQEPLRP